MRTLRICSFLFAIYLVLMSSCYSPTALQPVKTYPTANLSTTWTTNNYGFYQPILLRRTNFALFACAFSCDKPKCTSCDEPDCTSCDKPNCTSYYFSIFITGIEYYEFKVDETEIIWSANIDHPVGDNALLNFNAAGDLVLKDGDGSIVWTTNTAGKSVAGMNLTDTGNLVLFDHQNSVVWQSFDHPTDTLLPGQKLFQGQQLKSRVSLDNSSEGMFSFQVTDKGLVAYVKSNPPQAYFSMPDLASTSDAKKGRSHIELLNGSLSFYTHSGKQTTLATGNIAISTHYMKLMPDGHLKVFEWRFFQWKETSDIILSFSDQCRFPLVCGRNAICSTTQQCSCPVVEYFRPVNNRQLNLGCYEVTPLICNSTLDQHLITLENVTYFPFNPDIEGVDIDSCKKACLKNCSCKAAFFTYNSNVSSGECFLRSELFTMKMGDPLSYNASAFIKVQKVRSPPSSHQVTKVVGSTIGSIVLLLVGSLGFIMYVIYKRKRDAEMEEEYLDQVPGLPTRFSYEELKTATENFSKKLGEGGFGSVFEGSLKDGSKIAVKCLEGLSHIKKSFLAEVQSIGSIHHVNLVRLRGFCTWKSQRFLVYDFMCNGSLDRWIYHRNREHVLEWECRKKIILDIAKGLAYLHEECRQKIIHLDIKPQNILLDDNFNAKLSDFGLSKLIDRNQTQVMTTMRGTPGYLAPEWLSSVITEKVDVYSFGIVLLEILCGRKHFDRSWPEEKWHLLFAFQKCWEQDTLLDIIDMNSEDMQMNITEVLEMMKMASWCLQTDYTRRPSMSSVVKVLEGGMDIESNLDFNFTDPVLQKNNCQERDLTPLLPSILSGPR